MATNETTIEVAHLVELAWDRRPWGGGVRAECSCGWSGDWRTDVTTAADDGTEHREITVGPADEVDALMSGLLDLQCDLADTVIWLAENWSAELPVPSSRGTGDPVHIVLFAYCLDANDLTRAAALLGAPLVDDPMPDSYGTRYRRAVRHFGRVALEVYRAIEAVCDECGTALADEQCPICGQRADARPVTLGAA
jgi:hypothetical protein